MRTRKYIHEIKQQQTCQNIKRWYIFIKNKQTAIQQYYVYIMFELTL